MRKTISLLFLAVLVSHTYCAPQFITFTDGKLGVNFAGYHAAVGLGGSVGSGAGGGLFAEAGTPTGQSARAGLGGVVSENGGTSGGLYAGATAGGNIKASAGLAGGVEADKAAGVGYASAQAGNNYAASAMGGESSVAGSSDFSFSGKHEVVVPVQHVEVKPAHKSIHAEFNVDAINEVKPVHDVHSEVNTNIEKKVVHETVQPVLVKEVYVQPERTSTKVIHKEIIRTHNKPRRHHFRKTAFLGGYIGDQGDILEAPVHKTVEPQIQKRIDVGAESSVHGGAEASFNAGAGGEGYNAGGVGASHTYTKQVTFQRNPTFFADIFNIPISTLRAVGNFLGNTAANTNISVQKSASVHADSESKSLTNEPSSSSHSSSSSAHVSVETPNASKFIDDIFAIPINTLGAVNKFLENNVMGKKKVQLRTEQSDQ